MAILIEQLKANINRVSSASDGSSNVTEFSLVENMGVLAEMTASRTDQSVSDAMVVFDTIIKAKQAVVETVNNECVALISEGIMETIKEGILRFFDVIIGIFRKSDVVKAMEKVKEDAGSDWSDSDKDEFKDKISKYKDIRKNITDTVKDVKEEFKKKADKNAISSSKATETQKKLNRLQREILSEDRRMVANLKKGGDEKWKTISDEFAKHQAVIEKYQTDFNNMKSEMEGASSIDS